MVLDTLLTSNFRVRSDENLDYQCSLMAAAATKMSILRVQNSTNSSHTTTDVLGAGYPGCGVPLEFRQSGNVVVDMTGKLKVHSPH
jgi:hypothetical protein